MRLRLGAPVDEPIGLASGWPFFLKLDLMVLHVF